MGHLFSDGSFYETKEKRPSGIYPSYTFDFCTGSVADEDEIRNDFAKIGRKLPNGYEKSYEMNVEGRKYVARVRHVKLRDAGLASMFVALGAPIGDKVRNGTEIPGWLKNASLNVQREFLAAYLGGDATVPRMEGRNLVSQSSVGFHRATGKQTSGMQFANDLALMLGKFGVITNAVERKPGYLRKDGVATMEIRLRFSLSEENVLRLCHAIGVRYCSRKALSTNTIGEYLRSKSRIRNENREKDTGRESIRKKDWSAPQGIETSCQSQMMSRNLIQESVYTSTVRAGQLPEFDEWVSIARTGLEEPLLWESIVSIEEQSIEDVRDLTVGSGSHSFFANGFLVHNCDDHFHVEYLRIC